MGIWGRWNLSGLDAIYKTCLIITLYLIFYTAQMVLTVDIKKSKAKGKKYSAEIKQDE